MVHQHNVYIPYKQTIKTSLSYINSFFLTGRECGLKKVYDLPTGIIVSPNYPLNYKARETCEYEIAVLPDHEVVLSILEIDMPSIADCSGGDRILVKQIVEGSKTVEPLTVFCGKRLYSRYTVRGASRVLLEFKSDHRRGGTFKLRYNQVPSTVPTGTVSS